MKFKPTFTKRLNGFYEVNLHARRIGYVSKWVDGWKATSVKHEKVTGLATRKEAAAWLLERHNERTVRS